MFITLRASASRGKYTSGGMEQIVRQNARPGGPKDPGRPARRPACMECQTKKRRCTGNPRNCDRCRSRLIECVLPPTTNTREAHQLKAEPRRLNSTSRRSVSRSRFALLPGGVSSPDSILDSVPGSVSEPNPSLGLAWASELSDGIPQHQQHQHQQNEPHNESYLDGTAEDLDVTQYEQFQVGDGFAMGTSPMISRAASVTQMETCADGELIDAAYYGANTIGNYNINVDELYQNHTSTEFQPALSSFPEATTTAQPTPNILFSDSTPPYSDHTWGFPSTTVPPPPAAINAPIRCSCLGELLQLAQQLEDDEFHVTNLPLDEVLHLQKWLISQCAQSMDCTSCLDPMAVHTVRLMVCDHLTKIFEVIYGRIRTAGAVSTGHDLGVGVHRSISASMSVPSPAPTPSPPCLSPSSPPSLAPYRQNSPSLSICASTQHTPPTPPQLYYSIPNTTDLSAGTIATALNNTNTFLLSSSFRARYSPEEQIHVIRVLLRLQARDFRTLLARLVEVYSWMDGSADTAAEEIVGGVGKNGRGARDPAPGTSSGRGVGRQGRGARLVARVRGMGERVRRAEEGVTGE